MRISRYPCLISPERESVTVNLTITQIGPNLIVNEKHGPENEDVAKWATANHVIEFNAHLF